MPGVVAAELKGHPIRGDFDLSHSGAIHKALFFAKCASGGIRNRKKMRLIQWSEALETQPQRSQPMKNARELAWQRGNTN